MTPSFHKGAAFRTTSWSVVLAAADVQEGGAEEALAKLCEAYYRPLFSFIRRQGYSPENSEDLIQGFFAKLLEKNYLENADRKKGKFRTFLLSALSHYLSNEAKAAHRQKRGRGYKFISFDAGEAEAFHQHESGDHLTPGKMFERQWALSVLKNGMDALREEYERAGKRALYEGLQPYLTEPGEAPAQAELASRLDLSHGAVRVQVHRMKRRFGELVRAEIAETVADPGDVNEEVRAFLRALS